jgi:hypothetical protein
MDADDGDDDDGETVNIDDDGGVAGKLANGHTRI